MCDKRITNTLAVLSNALNYAEQARLINDAGLRVDESRALDRENAMSTSLPGRLR